MQISINLSMDDEELKVLQVTPSWENSEILDALDLALEEIVDGQEKGTIELDDGTVIGDYEVSE